MPNDLLQAALDYALKDHWPVFPVKPGGKIPLIGRKKGGHGVHDATVNEEQIRKWWAEYPDANIGINCGEAGLVVVDLDKNRDMVELERKLGGTLTPTLTVTTPKDGFHYYYKLDTSEEVPPSAGALAKGVDIRSQGSYVVAPPSRTAKNEKMKTVDGCYEWVEPWAGFRPPPVFRQPKLFEIATTNARAKNPHRHVWIIDEDTPENEQAAIDWINGPDCRPAVDGVNGDTMAYYTACMMRSYGLTEEKSAQVMADHYDKRCEPNGWGEDAYDFFLSKAESATRSATSQPGNMTAGYKRAHYGFVAGLIAKGELKGLSYEDLVVFFDKAIHGSGDQTLEHYLFDEIVDDDETPWIIDGWLSPENVWLMFGESGSFKTYITINMLLSVATGRAWAKCEGFAGHKVAEARPVVLFAGEGYKDIVQRVRAAIKDGGFTDKERKLIGRNLMLVRGVYAINRPDGLAGMARDIADKKLTPAVIAVDTMNLAVEGTEDSSEEIKKAMLGLGALAKMYKAASLALDHVGHGDGVKGRPKGSYAKIGNSDGLILCEREGKTRRVTLSQTKNRADDIEGYVATFEGTSIDFGGKKPKLAFKAVAKTNATVQPNPFKEPTREEMKKNDKRRNHDPVYQQLVDAELEKLFLGNTTREWTPYALGSGLVRTGKFDVGARALSGSILQIITDKPGTHAYRCLMTGKNTPKYQWVPPAEGAHYNHSQLFDK